jgi:hypothetical protein
MSSCTNSVQPAILTPATPAGSVSLDIRAVQTSTQAPKGPITRPGRAARIYGNAATPLAPHPVTAPAVSELRDAVAANTASSAEPEVNVQNVAAEVSQSHSLTVSRPPETAPVATEQLVSVVAASAPPAEPISVAGAETQDLTAAFAASPASDCIILSPPQHPLVNPADDPSDSRPPIDVQPGSSSASSPSPSDTEMVSTDAVRAPYTCSFFLKVSEPPFSALNPVIRSSRQKKRKSRILRVVNRAKKLVELGSVAQLSHQSTSTPAPAAESAPAITPTSSGTPAASPAPTFNPAGDGACLFHCINHAIFQDARSPSVTFCTPTSTQSPAPRLRTPLCSRVQLLWGDESEVAAIPTLSPSTQVILFNTDPEQFLAYPDIPSTAPDATRMVLLRLTKPALHYNFKTAIIKKPA